MISIIVAIDKNNAIGINGGMLCHLPNDLKYFKEKTSGHKVIMGKNTYYSLPKHPLPNRTNIVISKTMEPTNDCIIVNSVEEAIKCIKDDEEVFVIGGGSIYKQFIDMADKLYITYIDHSFEKADTFFPKIDLNIWKWSKAIINLEDEKNKYKHIFLEYIKI